MTRPHILIQGIGGIGGVVAGTMIEAGYRPVLVTGNPAITSAIRENGISVKTPEFQCRANSDAHTHLEELSPGEPFDVALLIMKAQTVVESARGTLPYLRDDGFVVTFQNGIVEDDVGQAVGAERVVSAVIAWGGTMHRPGVYERTSPGQTLIGELDGRVNERLRVLQAMLTPSAPVTISKNIRGVLWSKLAINCTINTVGALTGQTLGTLLSDRRVRTIFLKTYSEVATVADARGIDLEPVAANPRLLQVSPDANVFTRAWKDFVVRMLGRKYAHVKSSTLQSLERGRKTEVEFLNGYVVREAEKLGMPVPANRALLTLIREIEAGTRTISPQNVNDLVAMVP